MADTFFALLNAPSKVRNIALNILAPECQMFLSLSVSCRTVVKIRAARPTKEGQKCSRNRKRASGGGSANIALV